MQQADSGETHRTKTGQFIAIAGCLFFLGVLLYVTLPAFSKPSSAPPLSEAPPFRLALLDGGALSLDDLRGSVVLVNFWASWCDPCRAEAATLQDMWRKYEAQGVKFVGLAVNDTKQDAEAFIREFGITYPNGLDTDGQIGRAYRIRAVPETFLVGQDGRIARLFIGPVNRPKVEAVLDRLLSQ